MGEPRRSRRSSAKACLEALSGLAKELRSDNELDGYESDGSSAGFRPSQSSTESTSSPSAAPSEDLDEPRSHEEPSDASNSSVAITRSSGRKPAGFKSGMMERSISNFALSAFSPIVKYMASCRLRQLKKCKDSAAWHFSKSIEQLRHTFDTKFHPFLFHSSYHKEEYDARQSVLFPTTLSWVTYSSDDPMHCIPRPSISPMYSCLPKNPTYRQLRRFEFDSENKLLYVGGLVQAISWSPPRSPPETLSTVEKSGTTIDTVYLAISTLPTPDTRIFYTDPFTTHSGLIQVWDCGKISLKQPPPNWAPVPHVFIAHNWGNVLDLCWLPMSVMLVFSNRKPPDTEFPMADMRLPFNPFPQINRVGGHLIAACQDGLVRIFAVSRLKLDQVHFMNRGKLPLYSLQEGMALKLSVSPNEKPTWLGWPTRLHIRAEYPSRLFVGYSRGHVAQYNLNCLNPHFFTAAKKHLAPVKLFRLINGPVISLNLNPLNNRYLIAKGLDLRCAIWDLEDAHASNLTSPELSFNVIHGILGRDVLWSPRGDSLFYSREYAVSKRAVVDAQGVSLLDLNDIAARADSYVQQTYIDAPQECCRYLVPLGLQSCSCLDFSDSLNTLLCATDRGRLELVLSSLDGRLKQCAKYKFLGQLRIPLCQWTLEKYPEDSEQNSVDKSGSNVVTLECDTSHHPSVPNSASSGVDTALDTCPDCFEERLFCSHKLRAQYRLRLHDHTSIPLKMSADFLKTPYLGFTQARFCQNPGAATWLAAGTTLGFVQFIRSEYLYLKCFDELLHRQPDTTESPFLSEETLPLDKPLKNVPRWSTNLDTPPSNCGPIKTKNRYPAKGTRNSKQLDEFCPGRSIMFALKQKRAASQATQSELISSSESTDEAVQDAAATKDLLQAVHVRTRRAPVSRRVRTKRTAPNESTSLSSLSENDSDRTEPCIQTP